MSLAATPESSRKLPLRFGASPGISLRSGLPDALIA